MMPLRPARRSDQEAWRFVVSRDESVRKYAAVLFNIRRRDGGRSVTVEDAYQHARLAAFRAAQLFDETRGLSFMTLAAYWIRARLRLLFCNHGYPGANKRSALEVSLDDFGLLGSGENKARSPTTAPKWLVDLMGDRLFVPGSAADEIIRRERTAKLEAAIACLPERSQAIIKARFFEERSLDDIGRDLGLCRERVRQIEETSLKRLRAGITALESGRKPVVYPTFRPGRRSARMTACRGRTSNSLSASA